MELKINDQIDFLKISKKIFSNPFNESLVHQVVVSFLSKKRQGSKSQKSKAEVSGSNKKPWRQKGTGRARAGSFRSPIWRSGGVTFAAKPHSYFKKINKKMYKGALKSIFSELIRKKRLHIFKIFTVEHPKTKFLLEKLKQININDVLIINDFEDKNLLLSARNLYTISVLNVKKINPISLINFNNIIVTISAFKKIEETLK